MLTQTLQSYMKMINGLRTAGLHLIYIFTFFYSPRISFAFRRYLHIAVIKGHPAIAALIDQMKDESLDVQNKLGQVGIHFS